MSYRFDLFLLVGVLSIAPGAYAAQSSKQQKEPANTRSAVAQKNIDVCKLLTPVDIEGVQGTHVEELKPSAQPSGGLLMSQCLLRTSAPAKSVSIALAVSSTQSPKDFWRKQFHSGRNNEKSSQTSPPERKQGKAAEDEEEGSKPRAISGLGDEAFWVGGPITGALYVLRGDSFIRISLGGVRAVPERIEKSVRLARAALARM